VYVNVTLQNSSAIVNFFKNLTSTIFPHLNYSKTLMEEKDKPNNTDGVKKFQPGSKKN
jgi:hypothetical protein